jgi:hypothetical protein
MKKGGKKKTGKAEHMKGAKKGSPRKNGSRRGFAVT